METNPEQNTTQVLDDEANVGITEYQSEGKSIKVVTKYRYTDFLVNEIDLKGEIVKPVRLTEYNQAAEEKKDQDEEIKISEENAKALKTVMGQEEFENFEKFLEEVNYSKATKSVSYITKCPDDKNTRKTLHQTIRAISPKFDSETLEESGKKTIKISLITNNKRRRFEDRIYPDKYLCFTLTKTNYDSLGAIGLLARFLSRKPSNFSVAGTKDKRGVTSQKVCLFHAFAEDIQKNQAKKKWSQNVMIGDFSYIPKQFNLGDLKGNRFGLGLRVVEDVDDSIIQINVENLAKTGFINYYGLQRFGTADIKTHVIGKEALKKNWKGVVEMILGQKDMDDSITKIKQDFLANYDCKAALKALPNKCKIEKYLIEGLKNHGTNNFKTAFFKLPRNMRELYGHALQSFVWNKAVSQRVKLYGRNPVVGDLAIKDDEFDLEDTILENDVAPNEEGAPEDSDQEEKEEETQSKFDKLKVILITEENISQFTSNDLVLPLVGREIEFDEKNPISQIVLKVLEENDLTLKDFTSSDQNLYFRGGYRKIFAKATDVEWNIVKYNNKQAELLNPYYFDEKDPEGEENGKYKALRIRFNLPKSSYATMLIRELTKHSTSYSSQMELNNLLDKV